MKVHTFIFRCLGLKNENYFKKEIASKENTIRQKHFNYINVYVIHKQAFI